MNELISNVMSILTFITNHATCIIIIFGIIIPEGLIIPHFWD